MHIRVPALACAHGRAAVLGFRRADYSHRPGKMYSGGGFCRFGSLCGQYQRFTPPHETFFRFLLPGLSGKSQAHLSFIFENFYFVAGLNTAAFDNPRELAALAV